MTVLLVSDTYDFNAACTLTALIDIAWSPSVPDEVRALALAHISRTAEEGGVAQGEVLAAHTEAVHAPSEE